MRLATWNVNGLRARLDFVKLWLQERQPDLVGLQELKLTDEQFPHELFSSLGYEAVTHGQKAWNGVAVLARSAVAVRTTGLPGQEEMGARLITAAQGDLRFSTVYVPNGKSTSHDDYPRKLAWLDALIEHLGQEKEPPSALCGDFNICPAPIDSWNEDGLGGSIFHTEAERSRFARLLDSGYHDAYRERHPDKQAFSWWDYRGGAFHRKMGLRIDFMLLDDATMARVRDVTIDRDFRKKKDGLTASDHAPVIVDLV